MILIVEYAHMEAVTGRRAYNREAWISGVLVFISFDINSSFCYYKDYSYHFIF